MVGLMLVVCENVTEYLKSTNLSSFTATFFHNDVPGSPDASKHPEISGGCELYWETTKLAIT